MALPNFQPLGVSYGEGSGGSDFEQSESKTSEEPLHSRQDAGDQYRGQRKHRRYKATNVRCLLIQSGE